MATYVVLFNWTDQGIKSYRDSPSRVDAFNEQMSGLGVTLRDIYWTAGQYDLVGIMDAPDGQALSAALLQLGALGNVRSTSLRAYSRDEFQAVIDKAG